MEGSACAALVARAGGEMELTPGCQWPEGCNRGGFRTVSMPAHGDRFLCLRHCGAVWNERKTSNRAAGLCPCGADPSSGYRTCARCRERARVDRRRARAFNARAAECGIRLPRAHGRRREFLRAYCSAFKQAQRQALRRWRRAWNRGSLRSLTGSYAFTVAVPWEDTAVTVRAVAGLRGCRIHGVPAVAPGDTGEIEARAA